MTSPCYSHPSNPVRHSYPLAFQQEGISAAFAVCLQTSPLILVRLGVLLVFVLAVIVWLALVGGIASLFGGNGGLILFLIGFGLPAGIYYWLRQYILYMVKLAHVAVLTQILTAGKLPDGVNQLQYGKDLVAAKFGQSNILFALDALITGIVRAFNRTLDWIVNLFPIPGVDSIVRLLNIIVHNATTYIDETIFSYNLARKDENVWRSSMDGLVYYAQNSKAVLKTAAIALVIEYAVTVVIFVVCLAPALVIAQILPSSVSGFAWVFAVVLAYIIKEAFLHPLFMTMVAMTFHKQVQGQEINEQYAGLLAAASGKFEELCEKSRKWTGPDQPVPQEPAPGGVLPQGAA